MKPFFLVLPAAIVLAFAGGLLMVRAGRPQQENLGIDFDEPRHLVTRQMEIETASMSHVQAPRETGVTERGRPIEVAPAPASRPQFVLFIKDGCPCSVDAQPLFNRLSARFAGKVDFIGVIDGDRAKAQSFASQFSAAFPVVGDKDLKIVHDYHAQAGVYSALIARNGHIVKMWPGYSAGMLKEMNSVIAQTAAVKEMPFDPQYAPVKKAAGCAFATDWGRP